jgi:hypothetical protein
MVTGLSILNLTIPMGQIGHRKTCLKNPIISCFDVNQPSSAAPPPQVEELLQSIIQLLQKFVPRASAGLGPESSPVENEMSLASLLLLLLIHSCLSNFL